MTERPSHRPSVNEDPRERVLFFIHGIGNDDPEKTWLAALDRALRREGTETLAARGYRVVAPSYRANLKPARRARASSRR